MRVREFAAAKRSLAAFADVAGTPLRPRQLDALDLATRTTVIVAARQMGKSLCLALLALWWAYKARGQHVLIVSAGEDASRRVLAAVRAIATRAPILQGSVVDEQAALLTLSNGSRVKSVPASERQVRGERVDLLLGDEAALLGDDLILGAMLPTTAARPKARVVLASTATTTSGPFYDLAMAGDAGSEHVRTFRWVSTVAGGNCDADWLSPSAIAAARETMSAERFAAEYLADFASGADALLTPAQIEHVTADYAMTPLGALAGPAGLLGGVDWAGGYGRDRTTLVAVGRLLHADPGHGSRSHR